MNECEALAPGDSRVADSTLNNLAQKYAITNHGNSQYEIAFNIDYAPLDGRSETAAKMYEHTRKCLHQVSQVATAPGGKKVKFTIYTPSEASEVNKYKRPPVQRIEVAGPNGRSRAGRYESNISCAVLIHELLHLTGLGDEYGETQYGMYRDRVTGQTIFDYNATAEHRNNPQRYEFKLHANHCRAISLDSSSIMAQGLEGFLNKYIAATKVCECQDNPATKETCLGILSLDEQARNQVAKISQPPLAAFPGYSAFCSEESLANSYKLIQTKDALLQIPYFSNFSKSETSLSFNRSVFIPAYQKPYLGTHLQKSVQCRCSTHDKNCLNLLEKITTVKNNEDLLPQNSCPFSMDATKTLYGDEVSSFRANSQTQLVLKSKPEPSKPLFRAAQFERILYPRCKTKAPKYIECGKYSMVNAFDSCPDRPAYCEDESQWLDTID